MSHRPLTDSEITALENQGCFSSDWSAVEVLDPFSSAFIHQVRFTGKVKLGKLGEEVATRSGETKTSGIYYSQLENCEIGDHVLVDHVHLLKNYRIMDGVVLEQVHSLSVDGPSSFGNATEIEVLNEGGGRELLIFDRLSAQLAYLLVTFRHDARLIDTINGMIRDYAAGIRSATGTVGTGAEITHAGTIQSVHIGEYASIHGASLLKNGTIASNREAPVHVGENVLAKDFIMLSGSRVDGGSMVDKSFVGQGVQIGKQFSAENSVFFANSEAFHGEAVSVFGGPYTVSHHKSSLLIAGMYSFYNAGSGTNQSNHMYKLGPVHQGILERGSKTGSFAYLLWPCRIGAFSVVMGKNLASFDTSDFPFSYINVDHEKSILTPGMNLFTVGTRRDSQKWPSRDKRKDPVTYDLINFDFLSPYIVERVIRAMDLLTELYEKTSQKQDSVFHKGIRIKRLMLKSTRKYYESALHIFIGNQVIGRIGKIKGKPGRESLKAVLSPGNGPVPEKWLDLAGMIAPDHAIRSLTGDISSGKVSSLDGIASALKSIHDSYREEAWKWTCGVLSSRYGLDMTRVTGPQLLDLVSQWEGETIKLDRMILNDAAKEFDTGSRIGFGLDGDETVRDLDFEAVRGTPDENKFITGIREEIEQTGQKAAELKELLQGL